MVNISEKNKTIKVYLEFDCSLSSDGENYNATCFNFPDMEAKGYTEYMALREIGELIKLRLQMMINKKIPLPKVAVR